MPNPNELMLRQWTMLRKIPRYPQKITARALLEYLKTEGYEINKRTIERDLKAISAIFPLVSDEREKPFGWSWSKDAPTFDLPGLSVSEALTFKMAEQYLQKLLPRSMLEQMRPHFTSASKVLNAAGQHGTLAQWPDKIAVAFAGQPLLSPEISSEISDMVNMALLDEKQIEVMYNSRSEQLEKFYLLHPLGLVLRGPVTYLIATAFDFADPLMFALHRIQTVKILDKPLTRPVDFNLQRYIDSGVFGFDNGSEIQLKARFSYAAGQHLYETPLSRDQQIRVVDDGSLIVTATVQDNAQLIWWLRGFGKEVEVIEPINFSVD